MGRSRESKSPDTVIGRPPIAKVTLMQVAILALASSGMYFVDPVLSYSLLLGGLVAVVPQAYFAVKVFRYSGARSARQIARSSYVGEVGKFALSVVGFGLISPW